MAVAVASFEFVPSFEMPFEASLVNSLDMQMSKFLGYMVTHNHFAVEPVAASS